MPFYKKVIILKELENGFSFPGKKLSGIVRIEHTDGITELFLSTVNVSTLNGGCFYLFLIDSSKTVYSFNLGMRPYAHGKLFDGTPDVINGFSAGLCFIKDDLPITIAFGVSESSTITLLEFKKIIADTCLKLKNKAEKEKLELEERERFIMNEPINDDFPLPYDDEAVATENFYCLDDKVSQKLTQIKEIDNAFVRTENAMPFKRDEEEKEKGWQTNYSYENETSDYNCKKYTEASPYYLTVKDELDEVFNKFPPEQKLNNFFADSRWARVKYASNKYYVVGVVKENAKEKYICYGVPDTYSLTPPVALKDCATFIPSSIFNLEGEGYWMMFQDAITGSCIKLKKSNQ